MITLKEMIFAKQKFEVFTKTNRVSEGIRGYAYKGIIIYFNEKRLYLKIAWTPDAGGNILYEGKCSNIDYFMQLCKNIIGCGVFEEVEEYRCSRCEKITNIDDLQYFDDEFISIVENEWIITNHECFCSDCIREQI